MPCLYCKMQAHLTEDEVVWPENLAIGPRADAIHGAWLLQADEGRLSNLAAVKAAPTGSSAPKRPSTTEQPNSWIAYQVHEHSAWHIASCTDKENQSKLQRLGRPELRGVL